jgi:hypothetical protein
MPGLSLSPLSSLSLTQHKSDISIPNTVLAMAPLQKITSSASNNPTTSTATAGSATAGSHKAPINAATVSADSWPPPSRTGTTVWGSHAEQFESNTLRDDQTAGFERGSYAQGG